MTSYQESLKWIAKEQEFLDTIDLLPYFKEDKSIYEIRDLIEEEHGDQYKEEIFIFNCMSIDEFIDYLKKRYPQFKYQIYTDYRVAPF